MTEANKPSSEQSANLTSIPNQRLNWVKSPLVTQIKFHSVDETQPLIEIYYTETASNPSQQSIQITSMPTPDGGLRVRSEGKDIYPIPPKPSLVMGRSVAPPTEQLIKANTDVVEAGWSGGGVGRNSFLIGGLQLLPGTHIYEVTYWQTQLNWLDVKKIINETDAKGKGELRYPMTDNAPSNRLYFKVYMPTEAEAKQGKKLKFLGEVDAKTQVPQFPFARPGDFAHKTGYWRPVGAGLPSSPEVLIKEGESMPNFPGDQGVDPFSFKWEFVREAEKTSSASTETVTEQAATPTINSKFTGECVTVGEVCQSTGLYQAPFLGNKVVVLYQGQKVLGDEFNHFGRIIWYRLTNDAAHEWREKSKLV